MNRFERMIKRGDYATKHKIPFWQVLFKEDQEEDAFESKPLFCSLARLTVGQKERITIGFQLMNSFDGYCGILVGQYLKAHYSKTAINLPRIATFAMPKFKQFMANKLVRYDFKWDANTKECLIPEFAIKLIDADSECFQDVGLKSRYGRIFGSNVVIAEPYTHY